MMMQLNPPLPVTTPKGRGLAHMVIDYGPEADIVWVVFRTRARSGHGRTKMSAPSPT